MGSKNAKLVAEEVLETIGKGKKINLGKIALKKGYAKNTADNPKLITETKSYQEVVEPFLAKMIKERDRIIQAMETKDLSEVQYQHLAEVADKFTKNIQLLSGKPTERQEGVLSEDQINELLNRRNKKDSASGKV